jgi:hypothetical protein
MRLLVITGDSEVITGNHRVGLPAGPNDCTGNKGDSCAPTSLLWQPHEVDIARMSSPRQAHFRQTVDARAGAPKPWAVRL